MSNAKRLAKALIQRYEKITNSNFGVSELKLQKLMYYLQRQSLALTGDTLFDEEFEGWQHGPVLKSLRFILEEPVDTNDIELNNTESFLIDSVISQYGDLSGWQLRNASHEEYSWLQSRKGLSENDYGCNPLKVEDIEKDAENVRIYDAIFDMYVDEFDDF